MASMLKLAGVLFALAISGRAAAEERCDESAWPDKDHGLVCSDCKVLVDKFDSLYGTCKDYCNAVGRDCAGAWEEMADDCAVKENMTCEQTLSSSDAICECGEENGNGPVTPTLTPGTLVGSYASYGAAGCAGAAAGQAELTIAPCQPTGESASLHHSLLGDGTMLKKVYRSVKDCSGSPDETYTYDCTGQCVENPEKAGEFLKVTLDGCGTASDVDSARGKACVSAATALLLLLFLSAPTLLATASSSP